MILAIVVAISWSRSDDREAVRYDRAADRDGDAELNAYNDGQLMPSTPGPLTTVGEPVTAPLLNGTELRFPLDLVT